MKDEPHTVGETSERASIALVDEQGPTESTQPSVRYATDEAVRVASEKVFRLHARLLSELAK